MLGHLLKQHVVTSVNLVEVNLGNDSRCFEWIVYVKVEMGMLKKQVGVSNY